MLRVWSKGVPTAVAAGAAAILHSARRRCTAPAASAAKRRPEAARRQRSPPRKIGGSGGRPRGGGGKPGTPPRKASWAAAAVRDDVAGEGQVTMGTLSRSSPTREKSASEKPREKTGLEVEREKALARAKRKEEEAAAERRQEQETRKRVAEKEAEMKKKKKKKKRKGQTLSLASLGKKLAAIEAFTNAEEHPHGEPVAPTQALVGVAPDKDVEEAISYAGHALRNVPREWLQESSVMREALGMTPTLPKYADQKQVGAGDTEDGKLLLSGSTAEFDEHGNLVDTRPEATAPEIYDGGDVATRGDSKEEQLRHVVQQLHKSIRVLEEGAAVVRQAQGTTEPSLKDSAAYLRLIERSPTGVEALRWLDELHATKPEWLTPAHYEAAFALATEVEAPVQERDILVLFLKSREMGMLTETMYCHMFATLGRSSLRESAYPLLYQCLKDDYEGVANIPEPIWNSLFTQALRSNNVPRAVGLYCEIVGEGMRLSIANFLQLISLLARKTVGSQDQDVLDYLTQELQEETERVLQTQGAAGIPPTFFSQALAGCSPESAIRLWHFMKDSGVKVTNVDYTNLLNVMTANERIYEAEEIMKYVEQHHPEYPFLNNRAMAKLMMRLYAKDNVKHKLEMALEGNYTERSSATYVFSKYFGPESGYPLDVAAYMQLIRSTNDAAFIHEIYREMLSHGLQLETEHYNVIFRGMGSKIGSLTRRIEYLPTASPLDDEIPQEWKDNAEKYGGSMEEPKLVNPPAITDTSATYSPYDTRPHQQTMGRNLMPHETYGTYPEISTIQKRTRPFMSTDAPVDRGLYTSGHKISPGTLEQLRTQQKRYPTSRPTDSASGA
eukprot:Rhum_TRINITY_DN8665_c0_g1::Rhum_TRINITY_DN8665_c0_g1_i1::g.29282::m.29282